MSVALCDQVRSIDVTQRITERLGRSSHADLEAVRTIVGRYHEGPVRSGAVTCGTTVSTNKAAARIVPSSGLTRSARTVGAFPAATDSITWSTAAVSPSTTREP